MIASKQGKKTLEKEDKLLYPPTPSDFLFSCCLDPGAIFWNQFGMATYEGKSNNKTELQLS